MFIMTKTKQTKVCLFTRVSMVDKQSNDRQILELTQYCKEHNYKIVKTISSSISGTKTYKDRPDIQELLNSSKLYSKVLITETSRLGRCSKDIQATIASLHKQKIAIIFKNLGGLESLDENGQESFVTNIIISIYAELAQEERRILSERVRSGLVNARHKGKQLGRPFNTKEDRKTILKKYSKLATSLKNGYTLSQCQAIHKVSRNTAIKIKKLI